MKVLGSPSPTVAVGSAVWLCVFPVVPHMDARCHNQQKRRRPAPMFASKRAP